MKDDFLSIVQNGLLECGISQNSRVGVAVSGGADSVALLVSLVEILGKKNIFVITVNHNIRPSEESKADADFVFELCKKIGVFCKIAEIERGIVLQTAKIRGGGTEEAARFLRYLEFEKFLKEKSLDFLCLAHTQNDQIETLLMRFLQGSSQLSGIARRRGAFCRPLPIPRILTRIILEIALEIA